MIDEQSSVSGHDHASDCSAIGAGPKKIEQKLKDWNPTEIGG